jgi:hypothetical protein
MLSKKGVVPLSSRCGWPPVLALALVLAAAAQVAAQEAPHPLELTGFQPGRGYLSVLPWESIDVFSGSVVLTFTDLVLPGNAGLDLKVTRVYNSKGSWRWTIGIGPTVFDPPEHGPGDVRGDVRADGAALRQAVAAERDGAQRAPRDAAVGGSAERRVHGVLGHGEQRRL